MDELIFEIRELVSEGSLPGSYNSGNTFSDYKKMAEVFRVLEEKALEEGGMILLNEPISVFSESLNFAKADFLDKYGCPIHKHKVFWGKFLSGRFSEFILHAKFSGKKNNCIVLTAKDGKEVCLCVKSYFIYELFFNLLTNKTNGAKVIGIHNTKRLSYIDSDGVCRSGPLQFKYEHE